MKPAYNGGEGSVAVLAATTRCEGAMSAFLA